MLTYTCERCQNTTAGIYRDAEGDLVTECLACEHITTVSTDHLHLFEDEDRRDV